MTGPDPAGSLVLTRLPGRATAPDAEQVMRLFPPRPAGASWPATRQSREHILTRLLARASRRSWRAARSLGGPARGSVRRRPGRRLHRWRAEPAPLSDVHRGKRTSLG